MSDELWLGFHDKAKRIERRLFARRVAALEPTSIADLGCGPGYQLEHLHHELPPGCRIKAVDVDEENLEIARFRADDWDRDIEFIHLDLDVNPAGVPHADVTVMSNLLSYLDDPHSLLMNLLKRRKRTMQVIRNWDGATIRFGPMSETLRTSIDRSLRTSVGTSDLFDYFAMDRILRLLNELPYKTIVHEFEKFERHSPFSADFIPYYAATIDWHHAHCSDSAKIGITEWIESTNPLANKPGNYFVELDLVVFAS